MSGIKSDGDDNFSRQETYRKLVPGNSNNEELGMKRNNKEYAAFIQEYNILSEYNLLRSQNLKGIYVIPSAKNPFIWFGVQFIRQGIFQGGVFRFTITLPSNFPDGGCPTVVFQSKIFHPLINSETGELNTIWGFDEYRKNNRVWQLIQYITKVLVKVDSKMTPVNEEASLLLETNFEEFRERAKNCVKESLNEVYSPSSEDAHYITFSPYDKELHGPIKQDIYKPKEGDNKAIGFSWVQPGSLQPFSKPDTR